jgi:hypothetical protein
MIEAAGATLLYLPPCSPDFNPMKKAISKHKALLRNPPIESLTPPGTGSAPLLEEFTPQECANLFAAAMSRLRRHRSSWQLTTLARAAAALTVRRQRGVPRL